MKPILNKLWPLLIFWWILIILIWNMWLLNIIVTKLKNMFILNILNIVFNNIFKFNMSKPTLWLFSIYATSNLSGLIYHDWTLHYKPFFFCFILLLFSFCVLCFYFSMFDFDQGASKKLCILTLHKNSLLMNILNVFLK